MKNRGIFRDAAEGERRKIFLYQVQRITPKIYALSAIDWDQRNFHGYVTPRGVTYNAYLIMDEKICLVDTVKACFGPELLARIAQIVDPARIDYVITNHVEPDHSGALPQVMQCAPHAKIFLTAQGKAEVIKHYGGNYDFQVVKAGDVLNSGEYHLQFIPLPMLHWPDSMCCYLPEEKILFSNDAFGQHFCSNRIFDGENELSEVLQEAAKYYANILMPYARLIPGALAKLGQLPLKMIAPSHGVIWQAHVPEILTSYRRWAGGEAVEKQVLVVYDTMWGGTERMARQIIEGLSASGVMAQLCRITVSDASDLARRLLTSKGILVGSSTLNNGVLPTIGGFLLYLKGLKPVGKMAAGFGTYGWAGGAQKDIEQFLTAAGMQVEPGFNVKWSPTEEELTRCFAFGKEFGEKVLASE